MDNNINADWNDGQKSPGEQPNEDPVEQVQQFIYNVERTSERRPALRFALLVGGVAVGSYFGVGRHVKTLVKLSKAGKLDLDIIRDYTAAIGEVTVADFQMREGQAELVRTALKNGDKFKHFPGLGVWIEGAKNG